jgi:spermidine synthase
LASWIFLIAYTCSGLAGLVYEVTWTRLLTLYIGHTTAAASVVVAAFLGGLAIGAAVGGRVATALTPRRSLQLYVGLELAVALCALLLPFELKWFGPVLRWAYQDGTGSLYPLIRVVSCIVMVMLPALALGMTFPMAIRWFARNSAEPARQSSASYFVNTVGAMVGALFAGFVLIPSIGINGTIDVAMAATLLAALCVMFVISKTSDDETTPPQKKQFTDAEIAHSHSSPWLAIVVLGVVGFAALVHEIAWTRILALILGPTTYAFAATLAAVIAGIALGSGIGTRLVATRPSKAAGMLAFALLLGALTAGWSYGLAGSRIPMTVARHVADNADFAQLLRSGLLLTMALIVPTSACLGAAFP